MLVKPPFNRSHRAQDVDVYITVTPGPEDATFALAAGHPPGSRGVYGSFPHVAKGATTTPSKLMRAGYTALLRLLWVVHPHDRATRIPGGLAGASPPASQRVPLAPEHRPLVHQYLTGRTPRLLRALDAAIAARDLPAYMRPALARDLVAARTFFDLAPKRLHDLRRQHALPAGPWPARRWQRSFDPSSPSSR